VAAPSACVQIDRVLHLGLGIQRGPKNVCVRNPLIDHSSLINLLR
jgi:hypothetical protein